MSHVIVSILGAVYTCVYRANTVLLDEAKGEESPLESVDGSELINDCTEELGQKKHYKQ